VGGDPDLRAAVLQRTLRQHSRGRRLDRVAFYFWPDGRYQHHWNLARAYFGGNCFQTAQWQEVGTVGGTGPDFTFTPGHCELPELRLVRPVPVPDPVPVIPANHTLTLDHDATGWPLLRVGFPTGELVLEKCRRCQ
jgi:hypothetical protein